MRRDHAEKSVLSSVPKILPPTGTRSRSYDNLTAAAVYCCLLLFLTASRQPLEFAWRQFSWFSRKFSETFLLHDVTSDVGVGLAQRADVPFGPMTFRILEDDVSVYSAQRNP